MVKNSIFSILYLLANIGLLALLAFPVFLSDLFTEFALYIAAGCVLLMLLSTLVLAFQKASRPARVTKITLFYNDLVACGALALLYYMLSHTFSYLVVLVIPAILFFISFLFLIDDLIHYHNQPHNEKAVPAEDFQIDSFPADSLAVDPDIFESVSDVKEVQKEEQPATSSDSMFQGVEMRSISFDDFADYVEEDNETTK